MSIGLAHAAIRPEAVHSVGSPLYDVLPEHSGALALLLLLPVAAWVVRRAAAAGWPPAVRWRDGYQGLSALARFFVWLLMSSGAVHLALAGGHGDAALRLLFLLDALAMALITWRLLSGQRWRGLAGLILFGSIAAWWRASLSGEAPDQVALMTKLLEVAALAVVLRSASTGRFRSLAASAAVVAVVLLTGIAGWLGAFAASGDGHHHHGAVPAPGTVLSAGPARLPTAAERRAAERLRSATAAAIAQYADPAAAARDGYRVQGLAGMDFHASNPAYERDGRILDPQRPEALVYATAPGGRRVLLGAVFQMPRIGQPGPAPGGPLTVWHAHENVCISVIPPALSGLLSPWGGCPMGSINVPVTPEMIHVWTVPGAPHPFGDLDGGWRRAYLAAQK